MARTHKSPRIWEVYKQSKILRHQLERSVSGLELRLQSARRGKAGVSNILEVASRYWLAQRKDLTAHTGAQYYVCLDIFD